VKEIESNFQSNEREKRFSRYSRPITEKSKEMEKAMELLSAPRRMEEKIAGVLMMNQLLQGVCEKYGSDLEKRGVAVNIILQQTYQKITPEFIIEMLLSQRFPDVQNGAVDFISFHALSSSLLSMYEDKLVFFVRLLMETTNSALQTTLPVLIRHLAVVSGAQLVVQSVLLILSSSPTQQLFLPLLVDLLQYIDSHKSRPGLLPISLNDFQSSALLSLIIPGLFGAAPEQRRDETISHLKELLTRVSAEVLPPAQWIFAPVPLPPPSDAQKTLKSTSFARFLLRIVSDELHLCEEDLVCCSSELSSSSPSSGVEMMGEGKSDRIPLSRRYSRSLKVFLDSLDLCDAIVSEFLSFLTDNPTPDPDRNPTTKNNNSNNNSTVSSSGFLLQESSFLKEILHKITDELISFLTDTGNSLFCCIESTQNQSLQHGMSAATSRALLSLRFLRSEDLSLDEKLLSRLSEFFRTSRLVLPPLSPSSRETYSSSLPSSKVFFSLPEALSNEESTEFVDSGLILLLLCSDITEDMRSSSEEIVEGEEDREETERSKTIILEKMTENSSSLVTITTEVAKILLSSSSFQSRDFLLREEEVENEPETEKNEKEVSFLKEVLLGGISVLEAIFEEKKSDLHSLISMEGEKEAFKNILGCENSLVEELFRILSSLEYDNELNRRKKRLLLSIGGLVKK
jgi:hypothetical protein